MEQMLLSPPEVAQALRIGRAKVYALMASGDLPAVRIGRVLRVPVEVLRAWVQRQAQGRVDEG